jgi:SAM-dependent methyltransferase
MPNPWLVIPEADYVGHMSWPAVGQRHVLNRLLADALKVSAPGSVLVAGSSSGNGLEHLDPLVTHHVTCLDINQAYLRSLANDFRRSDITLDCVCADLESWSPSGDFDLVHAAIVLEYVNWPIVLSRLAAALSTRGMLSVILQRPSAGTPAVTPSPFPSLLVLESIFRFVPPDALVEAAAQLGLVVSRRYTELLPSDKSFEVLFFTR